MNFNNQSKSLSTEIEFQDVLWVSLGLNVYRGNC